MSYHIANLSEKQQTKLKQAEDELGVVLIAWKEEQKNNNQAKQDNNNL